MSIRSIKSAKKARAKQTAIAKPKRQGLNTSQTPDIGTRKKAEATKEEKLAQYRAALLQVTQELMAEHREELQKRAMKLLDGGWAPPRPLAK